MTGADDDISMEPSTPSAAPTGRVRVFLTQSALEAMNRHAADEPSHEIGGIMVGSVAEGTETFVVVEAVIAGQHMSHTRGSVTFTHESWTEINRALDTEYPDKKVVGWYHSHPGFGIFLSDYDLFIHRNFFSAPWQVAFVTDPKAATCGIFTWQRGELRLESDSQVFTWALASFDPAPGDPAPATPATALAPATAPAPRSAGPGILWALGFLAVALAVVAAASLSTYYAAVQTRSALSAMRSDLAALRTDLQGRAPAESGAAAGAPAPVQPASAVAPPGPGPAPAATQPAVPSAPPPSRTEDERRESAPSTGN